MIDLSELLEKNYLKVSIAMSIVIFVTISVNGYMGENISGFNVGGGLLLVLMSAATGFILSWMLNIIPLLIGLIAEIIQFLIGFFKRPISEIIEGVFTSILFIIMLTAACFFLSLFSSSSDHY